MIIWLFYEETQFGVQYGIAKDAVIFYLLYAIVSIPFSYIIDVITYNGFRFFRDFDFGAYLSEAKHRFMHRKTFWKGFDFEDTNDNVEQALQNIDRMAFSSQYYFIMTYHLVGSSLLLSAMQIIMQSGGYNPFSDVGSIPAVIASYILCAFTRWSFIWIGSLFRVWSISPSHTTSSPSIGVQPNHVGSKNSDNFSAGTQLYLY